MTKQRPKRRASPGAAALLAFALSEVVREARTDPYPEGRAIAIGIGRGLTAYCRKVCPELPPLKSAVAALEQAYEALPARLQRLVRQHPVKW